MWGHTEIPLHPRLETIKYNSIYIYYLISTPRSNFHKIFCHEDLFINQQSIVIAKTYCLSFLLLFVTMWILNIYPTLALLVVTFAIVQSLWSKITRLLWLSACCRCKTNITLTPGVEWLISRRTLFLLSFRIYIFLCRLMVAVLTIVHSSSRHPGCRQFHSSWSITWLRLHWRFCLGPPMSLFTSVFGNCEVFSTFFAKIVSLCLYLSKKWATLCYVTKCL